MVSIHSRFRGKFAAVMVLAPLLLAALGTVMYCNSSPAPKSLPWQLISGKGDMQPDSISGETCMTVTGGKKFSETNYWVQRYPFTPNTLYKLSCELRKSPGTTGGRTLIGSNIVNKDIDAVDDWTTYEFYFRTPSLVRDDYLRMGQWQVNGTVWFRRISLVQAMPVYKSVNNMELGRGEMLSGNTWTVKTVYNGKDTHCTRFLDDFDCYFNSNRWDFKLGSYVIFKHHLAPNVHVTNATITLNMNYYTGGSCQVQVSTDRTNWINAGSAGKAGQFQFNIPHERLPAATVYVKLISAGVNPRFQVNSYAWQAKIDARFAPVTGETVYIDKLSGAQSPADIRFIYGEKDHNLQLRVANSTTAPVSLSLRNHSTNQDIEKPFSLAPKKNKIVNLSGALSRDGQQIEISAQDTKTIYQVNFNNAIIDRSDYGWLAASAQNYDLWWCDAVEKIGKSRPAPQTSRPRIEISSAKNEYEAFQFVVRATKPLDRVEIDISDLHGPDGASIPRFRIQVLNVDYVTIQSPSDDLGSIGDWPDPLPPLRQFFTVPANENHPVWVQVYVPKNTPAGDYNGTVRVMIGSKTINIPVTLHVWDFTLPRETHLQTAMSLYTSFIMQYHHFENADNIAPVVEKYFQSFREHRISPYDPFVMGNIAVTFDADAMQAHVNFDKFDQLARKYLDDWKFNCFRLILQGIGNESIEAQKAGGTIKFKRNSPGYKQLMTDYLIQVQNHLEANGWLNKAYIYWKDEPDPEDYPLVREVNAFIHQAAPKLTRMLTEEPVPELYGYVDLWCPKLDNFVPATVEQRRQDGERAWWYICTSPKAPFPGLFIDHYAVELRTWIWQSWQHNLDGILIWSANYWNSEIATPPPALQDPYADPMSYMSSNNLQPGEINNWGNGDGRFIYPPKSVFTSTAKNYEGPVSSIRWEMLREGLEDYEYFWLLKERIDQAQKAGVDTALLNQARRLLIVPDDVSRSITQFSTTSGPLYEHRVKLARMIIKLGSQ